MKTHAQVGDHMQSEASRIVEWLRDENPSLSMPYEVRSAMFELESAIHDWTEVRCADAQIRVRAHLEPLEAAQAIIRLRQALWDCLVASGADTSGYDGPENWPGGTSLEDAAVGAVKELASDYEQVLFDR